MSHPPPTPAADPLITAAVQVFEDLCEREQFGPDKPEASLCFVGGDHVVIRNSWSEVIGRIPLSQVIAQPLN